MTRTIWKYALEIADEQKIEVPMGATPLSVQMQNKILTMWVLLSPRGFRNVRRTVSIRGTGHPVDGHLGKFVGTVQDQSYGLVWHVFVGDEEPIYAADTGHQASIGGTE